MNVNGARFHLLLGREDFERCFDGGGSRTLAERWSSPATSPEAATRAPAWDSERNELVIPSAPITLPPTAGESPLTLEARRAAAADRFGNIYWIAADRLSVRVRSAGSRSESEFWPTSPECSDTRAAFQPVDASKAQESALMLALAVTDDHFLVVAFARGGARGFLSFDLAAGGPPVETLWPHAPFEPFELSSRCNGGVWVLERSGADRRLWELDRRLAVVSRAQPEETLEVARVDDFQPLDGTVRERPARIFPGGIDLLGPGIDAVDPIAIETLDCNRVLLLDRDVAGQRSRILLVRREGDALEVEASEWWDDLAHDFVVADAYERPAPNERRRTVYVSTATTNQAQGFALETETALALRAQTDLFPLRRYGGRALLAVKGRAHYDSGADDVRWTPLVQQPRFRFYNDAEFLTPVFDAQDMHTTWDRVFIDACVPAGTSIEIQSCAADERAVSVSPEGWPQLLGVWRRESRPYLRSEGAELPWLRAESARAPRRENGVGTWEALLQNACGRYLQLRVRLVGNGGTASPRLRALRLWFPRFSYSQRFLPAVYAEEPKAANFIERWLANFEGTLTGIENRVAQAQALFDPRTAPAGALDWLAQWFDVAFDPAWDEARRRLFVRRAMDFFRWRGTTHGLRIALELAFDACVDERLFDGPHAQAERPQSIRIVESFMTRLVGSLTAGDPGGANQPRQLATGVRWQPAEGNAGLADRYAKYLGRKSATPLEQMTPFPLAPPENAEAAGTWSAFVTSALGFVPAVGAQERSRWREYWRAASADSQSEESADIVEDTQSATLPTDWPDDDETRARWKAFCALVDETRVRPRWVDFLARRYRRIEQLNRAYRTRWPSFAVVALPVALPATSAAQFDWLQFEGQLLPMHRTAHRFSVLLPMTSANESADLLDERLRLAQRIVNLEKPAHTIFDVRLYWALNRLGEARLGVDTLLGQGSRAPELIPYAQLGRAYVGSSFVAGQPRPSGRDRLLVEC